MYTKNRKVDPKKDFYFKKLFGTEGNKDILKDFLEAILNVEIHIIELEKFKATKEGNTKLESKLEECLSYLLYDREELRNMAIKKNPKIQKAEKELKKLTQEQEEYLEELREKGRMDRLSIAYAAERDGREAGMKKGIAEGIEKGMAQGKAESQHEIVKRMLNLWLDIDIIEKSTELSKEEILKIKEDLKK